MHTSTPDRQTFRALVADIAARAKARLPEAVNGRVESAAKLVLLHDVMPQEDGSILVGSSTDPMKSYLLVGDTCECQDWQHGKAPQGWCQHRIAAGIHKRVGEVLAAQTPAPVELPEDLYGPDNDIVEPVEVPCDSKGPQVSRNAYTPLPEAVQKTDNFRRAPLPEAPASVNVRVQVAGRECQLTLRDSDEARLLARLEAVLERFPVEPKPARPPLRPQQQGAAAMHRPVSGFCAVHNCQMRLNTGKDGRQWWSHRLAEGGFCKGK